MADWKLVAQGLKLNIPPEDVERLAPRLDPILEAFRRLTPRLDAEKDPAIVFRVGGAE
jgi:hypothetical protein